jgi:transcriptional regulator with XRE-family HTH domain
MTKLKDKNIFAEIGQYFKDKREEAGMTQEELSQHLGYKSKQIVSNWERGLCNPPLSQVALITKLLKLNESKVVELFIRQTKTELKNAFQYRHGGLKKAKSA